MPPPEKRRKKSHARAKSSGGSGGDGRAWEALDPPLTEWVLRAVTEGMGLEKMTPVQASVIPLAMGNKDVVCEVCWLNYKKKPHFFFFFFNVVVFVLLFLS